MSPPGLEQVVHGAKVGSRLSLVKVILQASQQLPHIRVQCHLHGCLQSVKGLLGKVCHALDWAEFDRDQAERCIGVPLAAEIQPLWWFVV